MQNALKDGRLKFIVKQKPQVEEEVDPNVEEALLIEPVDVLMVDITDDINTEEVEASYEDHVKVIFPKVEEELIDFLNRCKLKDSKVTLCQRCNYVFDKETIKKLENINPYQSRKGVRQDKQKEFSSIGGGFLKRLKKPGHVSFFPVSPLRSGLDL